MTKKWRQELVSELEQKGAIRAASSVTAEKVEARNKTENELNDKAQTLDEARQNEHMLNLQTGSVVLANQQKPDRVDFKNEKQEALYNKFIQETPFYAKKHKAVLYRPQPSDFTNQDTVIKDARKRFEADLMRSKQRKVEDEKELKALEQESNKFQMQCDIKRRQEKQAIREILHEQMSMD